MNTHRFLSPLPLSLLAVAALLSTAAYSIPPAAASSSLVFAADTDTRSDDTTLDTTNTDLTHNDNSAMNQGDQNAHAATADHAGMQPADRDNMKKIRKAVMADKSLSTYAQNVKIISRNGVVTLKGPVTSQQEKQSVESKAAQIVGVSNVRDKLTVKTTSN